MRAFLKTFLDFTKSIVDQNHRFALAVLFLLVILTLLLNVENSLPYHIAVVIAFIIVSGITFFFTRKPGWNHASHGEFVSGEGTDLGQERQKLAIAKTAHHNTQKKLYSLAPSDHSPILIQDEEEQKRLIADIERRIQRILDATPEPPRRQRRVPLLIGVFTVVGIAATIIVLAFTDVTVPVKMRDADPTPIASPSPPPPSATPTHKEITEDKATEEITEDEATEIIGSYLNFISRGDLPGANMRYIENQNDTQRMEDEKHWGKIRFARLLGPVKGDSGATRIFSAEICYVFKDSDRVPESNLNKFNLDRRGGKVKIWGMMTRVLNSKIERPCRT